MHRFKMKLHATVVQQVLNSQSANPSVKHKIFISHTRHKREALGVRSKLVQVELFALMGKSPNSVSDIHNSQSWVAETSQDSRSVLFHPSGLNEARSGSLWCFSSAPRKIAGGSLPLPSSSFSLLVLILRQSLSPHSKQKSFGRQWTTRDRALEFFSPTMARDTVGRQLDAHRFKTGTRGASDTGLHHVALSSCVAQTSGT
ncbi:hypothetical protein DFH08DRAFT_808817 [Mycena albidolilacea]|uniref:Uncharacterized protein n=1 Tax=Mycena albidolilacea TaxID=1033008 RepID=A0AAD7A2I2_9AGAR|nr:hypothetical protein DFH08DRAFT_808817 [Mycena albidolilacea]